MRIEFLYPLSNRSEVVNVQPSDTLEQACKLTNLACAVPYLHKLMDLKRKKKFLTMSKTLAECDIQDGHVLAIVPIPMRCYGCLLPHLCRLVMEVPTGCNNMSMDNEITIRRKNSLFKLKGLKRDFLCFYSFVKSEFSHNFVVRAIESMASYERVDEHPNPTTTSLDFVCSVHNMRCPICFERMLNNGSIYPARICQTSEKHLICSECASKGSITKCPICRGQLITGGPFKDQATIDRFKQEENQILQQCILPEQLSNIIRNNLIHVSSGGVCNIFKTPDNLYAVKCPHNKTSGSHQSAIIHEIALALPFTQFQNIVSVYGGLKHPTKGLCIVMEYVDGPNLSEALDTGVIAQLDPTQILKIALGIVRGMNCIHQQGIIHRDFKPENVLLQSRNGEFIPKVTDFGSSFLLQTLSNTCVDSTKGTVGYDAPEVVEGNKPSMESDIYALSFTLYELLSGKRPFRHLKPSAIIAKFSFKNERPGFWPQHINQSIRQIIERGWSPDPNNRPTIYEFSQVFENLAESDGSSLLRSAIQTILPESSFTFNVDNFIGSLTNFEGFALSVLLEKLDDNRFMEIYVKKLFEELEIAKRSKNEVPWTDY